jgi:DNA-binding NarL/FixJ family response regulator
MTARILIAEEHLLCGDTLAAHIESALRGTKARAVASLPDALEVLALGAFDLALLDLGLPGMRGLSGIRALRERHPGTKVAVLAAGGSGQDVVDALRAGAVGFVPQSLRRDAAAGALRLMLDGGLYVPADALLSPGGLPGGAAGAALQRLTAREREVLRLLLEGLSNKEIARRLGLGVGTVAIHLNRAYRKLGVTRRTQAVQAILAAGWNL